jgi:hypothetical protein
MIFPPPMGLLLVETDTDHPGDNTSNSRANLGRPPDFGSVNMKAPAISCELVWSIIDDDLDMRMVTAKWVPK